MIKKPSVFIGLAEIAGYYNNLASGLREMGFETLFYTIGKHRFNYNYVENSRLLNLGMYFGTKRLKTTKKNLLKKILWASLEIVIRFIIFVYVLKRCKIFIFGYGQTFLPNGYDLYLLKFLGKTVISNIGHGSEARHPLFNGSYKQFFKNRKGMKKVISLTHEMKKKIQRIEQLSNFVIGTPNSSHYFLKSKFISWHEIGQPGEKLNILGRKKGDNNSKFKILHCPSNKDVKGTNFISRAIKNLQKKGLDFEYIEISNLSHKDALVEIENCDLLIDELFSDIVMSGIGCEAAWLNKAVIVGSYAKEELEKQIPKEIFPPVIICKPEELELTLKNLIRNNKEIKSLGSKAYKFVSNYWNKLSVANNYNLIFNNQVPNSWWINPLEIKYIHGVGLHEEEIKQNIRTINKEFSKDALCLSDRPDLEKRIFRLIEEA